MTWGVVVPSNRPERFEEFFSAWRALFQKHDVRLFVVWDMEKPPDVISFPKGTRESWWGTIPDWIPRCSDMIRSWGFYQSWKEQTDYTLSLDDDVLPATDVFEEYERVFSNGAPFSGYFDVGALSSYGRPLRGFPYRDRKLREVAVQYGVWRGVLDYDAATQLSGVNDYEDFSPVVVSVPHGAAFTGCIMNCAFRTKYAKEMWQFPVLDGKFNRFGDIWSGLVQKRVFDFRGSPVVVNGRAVVDHRRASDPVTNLERELPGVRHNEELWRSTSEGEWESVTENVWTFFSDRDSEYASYFRMARNSWASLFA